MILLFTVFTMAFTQGLFSLAADESLDRNFWEQVIKVREAVGKHLEEARKSGAIGSSLDAELDLYCGEKLYECLAKLKDELRFVLITSYARLHEVSERPETATATEVPGLSVRVSPSDHAKCSRCWHHREDVGSNGEHPELCGRCVENVAGEGEARRFA